MFEKEAEEYIKKIPFVNGPELVRKIVRKFCKDAFKDGAEFGYNKANEYAKTIIQDLLDNSDEYAKERAVDFLKEVENEAN